MCAVCIIFGSVGTKRHFSLWATINYIGTCVCMFSPLYLGGVGLRAVTKSCGPMWRAPKIYIIIIKIRICSDLLLRAGSGWVVGRDGQKFNNENCLNLNTVNLGTFSTILKGNFFFPMSFNTL